MNDANIDRLIARGRTIQAVAAIRQQHTCSLAEAIIPARPEIRT